VGGACGKKTATKVRYLVASSLSEQERERVKLSPGE
jgi:hypothetical protein